ncbi:MAG: hypothetical protein ACI9KN_000018 [Gammaproteobacteria bacterium]|jgi:hypothetical protein
MNKPRPFKLKAALISSLLVLGLTAGTAQANHLHQIVAPLATVAALTYIFGHNNHHYSTRTRTTRYSYGQHQGGGHHSYQRHNKRKHSHSSGGYSHNSKHHYKH